MKVTLKTFITAAAIMMPTIAISAECKKIEFEGNQFTVCTSNIKTDRIELFLQDENQQILGSFSAIQSQLKAKKRKLVFAFNAGMYHPDRQPVGLFISNGKKTTSVKIGYGTGNFSLKPNGVFYLEKNRAAVEETTAFIANKRQPQLATQSGPMLVINNKLHPMFQKISHSKKIRNGVGVKSGGKTVIFALSENRLNFYAFARFFRDRLKTPNALYLDGTISQIYSPQTNRTDSGTHMGPMIGVTAPVKQ